jgi:hypothetical protein
LVQLDLELVELPEQLEGLLRPHYLVTRGFELFD